MWRSLDENPENKLEARVFQFRPWVLRPFRSCQLQSEERSACQYTRFRGSLTTTGAGAGASLHGAAMELTV